MKLYSIAKIVRSKNADPYTLTIDIIFEDEEAYFRAKKSEAFTRRNIAQLYKVPEGKVKVIFYDPAYAIKISIPRRLPAGSPGCRDVYGAQQHAPLLDLDI